MHLDSQLDLQLDQMYNNDGNNKMLLLLSDTQVGSNQQSNLTLLLDVRCLRE